MTTRAAFRQSDLTRAIRAYQDATGKTPVVQIVGGTAILRESGEAIPDDAGENTCDKAFGVTG